MNPQTGLFEQTVRLTNSSANTFAAARLLIQALPADVMVYNASGSISNIPFVQYNQTLAPTATVVFLIEYYRTNRQEIPQPALAAQETTPIVLNPFGTLIPVNRNAHFEDGRFLIEFTSIPGRRYAVQYSSDLDTWKTASPILTAPANRVQWYDDGPPKTESKPASGNRFYQILLLP